MIITITIVIIHDSNSFSNDLSRSIGGQENRGQSFEVPEVKG